MISTSASARPGVCGESESISCSARRSWALGVWPASSSSISTDRASGPDEQAKAGKTEAFPAQRFGVHQESVPGRIGGWRARFQNELVVRAIRLEQNPPSNTSQKVD